MKRIRFVVASLLLLSLLTACGGQGGKEPAPFDPASDTQSLLGTAGVFEGALEELDQATACALYGIDEGTVESCKVYVGNAGVSLEELAIFVLSSDDGAEDALVALQYRLEDQREAAADYAGYLKDELSKLDGARAERRGRSVLLVIAANYGPVDTFLGG